MSDLPRLLTLTEAAARLGGKVTASSLRTEAKRGRLQLVTIAGKHHVTEQALQAMIALCHAPESPQDLSSDDFPAGELLRGTSPTDPRKSAQDALKQTLRELRSASRSTRAQSTTRPKTSARA